MQRGLDNCIRLGVNGADAVTVHQQVSGFIAVRLPGRRAVKACRQDSFIEHKHAAYESSVAGAAF